LEYWAYVGACEQIITKFFYERLVNYMMSGETEALVLAHSQALQRWRDLMGPTKPSLAQSLDPDSIRALHGLTDTRNAVHGSGCEASFLMEMDILFPDFNIQQWYQTEEPLFRIGRASFCEHSLTHRPLAHHPDPHQEELSMSF
jgi:nucleoside-diphosphate kinase